LQDAAATASKHKQDVQWLMQDHRRELAEAHRKNQELTQDTQQLRMRLLELEQQLWGGAAAPAAAAPASQTAPASAAAAADAEAQAAAAALVVQQQEQLALLQNATLQLTQEKQQLMKTLQVGQGMQMIAVCVVPGVSI
jgi:chromosome condensin MukBEF ATPase and DNA-binding subunit MukB